MSGSILLIARNERGLLQEYFMGKMWDGADAPLLFPGLLRCLPAHCHEAGHGIEIAHRCRDSQLLFQEIIRERSLAILSRNVQVCSIVAKGKFFRQEIP